MTEVVERLSDGECDCISEYQKVFYFSKSQDDGSAPKRIKIAGYAMALGAAEHYKSSIYMNVYNVIFEEFISKLWYLRNEPRELLHFVSTILRIRDGRVWLIGNTISRVCPYVDDWGLTRLPRQKQGTIDVYKIKDKDDIDEETGKPRETIIAVEFCEALGQKSSMFFGSSKKNITEGYWETELKPTLKKAPESYLKVHELVIEVMNFKFYLQLLQGDQGTLVWYVQPKTTDIQKRTRVISDRFNESRLWSSGLYPLNDKEAFAFSLLRQGKVCYSDSLTGTDFEQCMKSLSM